jgi:ATP-dependent Clp protease ATP-binding subunit ClpC
MFNSLKREDIHKIIDIELGHLYKRISELGYDLKLTDEAKDFLVRERATMRSSVRDR